MGLGLHLEGRRRLGRRADATNSIPWLGRVEQWLVQQAADLRIETRLSPGSGGEGSLYVVLHPAAEEVELRASPPDEIVLLAKTSTVGPAYHARVCDLATALGRAAGVSWVPADGERRTDDETGYFEHRDAAQLESSFLVWLRELATQLLAMAAKGYESIAVSLPLGHTFESDGAISTPMGPRDRSWIEAVAVDPGRGIDMFPWWRIGDEADLRLGRAIERMWTFVRWRPPLADAERDALRAIVSDLDIAWRLDPRRAYPHREWRELLALLGEGTLPSSAPSRSQGEPAPLIGYRRRSVTVAVGGGWSVRIPGALAERYEDDGRTYCAFDEARTVRVSTLTVKRKGDRPSSADDLLDDAARRLPHGDAVEARTATTVGRGVIERVQDGPDAYFQLDGRTAAPSTIAITTICFPSANERDWAVNIWRSLARAPDET